LGEVTTVNERDDKYDGHDEGEYHFSDEHTSYEVDNETTKVADVAVAKGPALTKSRRVIIALGVFFFLMFIVYKMLIPSSTTLPITGAAQSPPASSVTKPAVVQASVNSAPPAQSSAPAAVAQVPDQQAMMPATMPADAPVMTVAAPASDMPVGMPPAVASSNPQPVQPKEVQDRVAALEQQNAKLANELHIEYPQKISDIDTQSAAAQAKLQELNTRVANIEAALTQITQLLQGSGRQASAPSAANVNPTRAARAADPKQMYTVQAIIPGRAWLKSDAGETVTVAEGDILRDYGRVTKIDPYDGIVDIDTGNKMVSLSYGAGGD
jgi:intracellular multiplication protein IcmG